jgi:hypothetical protein
MIKATTTTAKKSKVESTRSKFTIRVFPHVKKFILKHYGSTEPIKTEEYATLGKMVTLSLRDNRAHAEFNDQYRDRLTETLTIILTREQSKMGPRLGKLTRINIHIDGIFKEHMLTWINALKVDGIPAYTAIKMFLDYYELDEPEYSLNTAHQFYKRANGLKN